MAAQVALKRQQAAEDAIALGLRACVDGSLPVLQPGPLWGPGTASPPEDNVDAADQRQLSNDTLCSAGRPIYYFYLFRLRLLAGSRFL